MVYRRLLVLFSFKWLRICLFIPFTIPRGSAMLSVSPQNQAVRRGEPVEMKCVADSGGDIYWDGYGEDKRTLYMKPHINPSYVSYYKVNNTLPGQFDLTVNSSVTDAAIEYICVEQSTLLKERAQLTIIDKKKINCSQTTTTDVCNLFCHLEVYGNWLPRLSWFANGSLANNVTLTNERNSITATLNVPMKENNVIYECQAWFEIADKPQDTTATNKPVFNDSNRKPNLDCCIKINNIDSTVQTVVTNSQSLDLTTRISSTPTPKSNPVNTVVITLGVIFGVVIVISSILFIRQKNIKQKNRDVKARGQEKQSLNTVQPGTVII